MLPSASPASVFGRKFAKAEVRCTMLALRLVATEIVEFGHMAGCSRRQLLWKVMIPAARPTLMVGVNQVIMLSLNMVIIASMIGAGGLGFDVLSSLKRLRIGEGIEAGLAITFLAIALDRLSQAFANRPPPEHDAAQRSFWRRNPYFTFALIAMAATTILGAFVDAFESFPEGLTITTGPYWNDLVSWINVNFFDQLDAVKSWLLLNAMIPIKRFMLALPWVAVTGLLVLAGYQLGGWRLATLTGSLAAFMAVTRGLAPSFVAARSRRSLAYAARGVARAHVRALPSLRPSARQRPSGDMSKHEQNISCRLPCDAI